MDMISDHDNDALSAPALRSALACARTLLDELERASGVDEQTGAPSWLTVQVADELAKVARMIKRAAAPRDEAPTQGTSGLFVHRQGLDRGPLSPPTLGRSR
jgi:hypothetical protein